MGFDDNTVQSVWEKGRVVSGNDPSVWRQDQCNAWICRHLHGNRDSQYGWEIDHITPESEGGSDDLYNLRPLQWKNNASKQDGRLVCSVAATGSDNS